MPLQLQVVPIEIATGIDTKTDPKKVTGKLISLVNAVFQEAKALLKRNGFLSLSQSILNGSSIASGATISPYQSELVELDGKNLYSYSDQQAKWVNKGTVVVNSISVASIVKNSNAQVTQDQALHSSGFQVFTWEDSSGGSRYSVIDTGTGQTIVNNALISSTGYMAKPMALGNYIVIVYYESSTTSIDYKAINMSTPTTLGSAVVVANDLFLTGLSANTCTYDLCLINTNLYITYNSSSGSTGFAGYTLSPTLTLSSKSAILPAGGANLATFGDSSFNIWFGWFDGVSIKAMIYSQFYAAQVLAPTVVENVTADPNYWNTRNITGIVIGTTGHLFYESNQLAYFLNGSLPAFYGDYIRTNTITLTGTVGTAASVIRSLGLASKPFVYSGVIYMLGVYDAERTSAQPGQLYDPSTESTYFVIDLNGNIITKVAQLNGGGVSKKFIAPEAITVSSNVFQFSYLLKDLLVSNDGNVYTQTGVQSVQVSFTNVFPSKLEIGKNLLLGGGTITAYDGAGPTELNFHLYPELMTAWVGSMSGALSAGSYEYESVYEWTDNQGQINRSAPSDPLVVATALPVISVQTQGSTEILPNLGPTGDIYLSLQTLDNNFLLVGDGLPANTLINSLSIVAGSGPFPVGVPKIVISTTATASAPQVNVTATPQFLVTGSTTDLSNQMSIDPIAYLPLSVLIPTNATALGFYASDISAIAVGMTVSATFTTVAGSTASTITAIDPVSRFVTVSGAFVFEPGTAIVHITKQFTGTFTNGSATVTGVSAGIFPLLNNNDLGLVGSSSFRIIGFNAGASTITLSSAWGGSSGSMTATIDFAAGAYLKAGQTISGTGLPANTIIYAVAIQPFTSSGGQETTLTLSTKAILTESEQPYTITNMFSAVLTVPTARATNKNNVSLVGYRTTNDQTILYRFTSVSSPIINNRNIDFASIYDGSSDYSIVGNEQIYTTGGEVDNAAPPASSAICTFKNRAILIPNENRLSFWYSKQVIPGSPTEFSENFVENVDAKGGPLSCVATMDDKLILFKQNNIFYVVGDGPTPAGTLNDFSEAQIISTDTGCSNPASIVLTPDGLMFQSPKGIYLLARNLQVVYIGDAVEAYNSFAITSALLIQNLNQVRFTITNGTCLVYDYYFKQWSVFTNIAAVDACIYQGIYNYLTSAGLVNAETIGSYTDNGAFIQMSLTTSWMSLAGLQAFQRVWRLVVLGLYKSPHTLLVNVAVDFASSFEQNVSIPVTSNPGLYEYRIHMKQQKCTAMQFQIMDSQSSSFGEGLQLSEITLEVGAKVGTNKLQAGKTF